MYFVYVLQSLQDKNLYIGISMNVEKRLLEHNRGYVKSTKHRRPFKLIYTEKVINRKQARIREKKLKSGSGREFLRDKYILQ